MANILLTNKCVRTCPYCFAEKEMSNAPSDVMSWENILYLADFLQSSGQRQVSLLGGEPTVHPLFTDIVLYFIERNFKVTVFTSGILSKEKLGEFDKYLTKVHTDHLSFVCNLNNPEQTKAPKSETEKVHKFLSAMGPWTSPGFNLYRIDFDLGFIFDLVNRYGLKRHLRLGIAHPVPGLNNNYITPDNIGNIIERLYSYKDMFNMLRIEPGMDCGFPLCKITDEQLGWFNRLNRHTSFECGPAIDITPDMQVYYCFPLSSYRKRSLFEFDSLQQVNDYFDKIRKQILSEIPGIYEECENCVHKDNARCSGGGICQILNMFTGEARIRLPEIENGLNKTNLPV